MPLSDRSIRYCHDPVGGIASVRAAERANASAVLWFNSDMAKEHRREIYGTTDPGALRVPEAKGPDGVPVTLRVEPAVDRLRRWRNMTSVPDVVSDPVGTYVGYRLLPKWVQKFALGDRWVVDVEADSGERCRVPAPGRAEAVEIAQRIHAGITADGIQFLSTFAK